MSGIRLWNGDICELAVDAIVVPATPALWMTSGAAAAVKQRGGHGIEFEAVARAPQPTGSAVATGAGTLACRNVIHAVSLGADRRTSAAAIDSATRAALRLASGMGLRALALPALGSPLGGVPLAECARIMVQAIHETLAEYPDVDEVVIALRSERTYRVFQDEVGRRRALRAVPIVPGAHGGPDDITAPPRKTPVAGEGASTRHDRSAAPGVASGSGPRRAGSDR
jgi:O-acetyl-ADP-ribose deacetylase